MRVRAPVVTERQTFAHLNLNWSGSVAVCYTTAIPLYYFMIPSFTTKLRVPVVRQCRRSLNY